jgi:2-polyprenyl-3-methyl-5-hydroxy-6-metoxy-1,4-benzoquinol methylase
MGKIAGKLAGSYDRFVRRTTFLPEGLLEMVRSTSGERIVEFGCGTGTVAVGLGLQGFEVVGVDYSPAMLKEAKRKARENKVKVRFVRDDILKVDLRNKFDLLLCLGNTVPHFTSKRQLTKLIRNCKRHLGPKGGSLIFQLLNYDRIMMGKPGTFAIDVADNFVRFKQYRYRKHLVDFVVTLVEADRIPPKMTLSRTTLKPWTKSQIKRILADEGFNGLKFYGSYGREQFTEKSKDLIVVGRL